MKRIRLQNGITAGLAIALAAALYSCASIGNPNGGPYDETPPKFVSSIPAPNQTNFKGNRVEILFDELIQLERPSENVIVTPPQMQLPVIRTAARRVIVELKDTLKENSTYTIDFTNSIADNNEKNVFQNFSFAFSTGATIDSLAVSGILLNAENLEPMPGITVGIHSNPEDSAFIKEPFLRTSRTNDRGRFTIRNIAEGASYRIYALNDANRDYRYDTGVEELAFTEKSVTPAFEFTTRQDTLWADTITIDTILTVPYTRFLPDDITLFLFKEPFERQYMLRPERPQENKFTLTFNAPLDTIPKPVPINFSPADSSWYYLHVEGEKKVVNFWITDSTVWRQDTLRMQLTYPRSDSLNILQPQTDTLQLFFRRPASRRAQREEEETPRKPFLPLNINASGAINIYDTVSVVFDEPVTGLTGEEFFLNQKVDTLWVPVDFEFLPDTANSLRYFIQRKWNYGEQYLLEADSATIYNVYGKWNDKYSNEFSIKGRDAYGHLYINVAGIDTTAFIQLLDMNDKPVRQAAVNNGGVLFMNLQPEKYYARLIVDLNNNGKWDTGNYAEKRQPEQVFYWPKLLTVMQNWEVEENWDINEVPADRQKPMEITKNKPQEAPTKNRDYRNEGRQTQSSGSSGFPF